MNLNLYLYLVTINTIGEGTKILSVSLLVKKGLLFNPEIRTSRVIGIALHLFYVVQISSLSPEKDHVFLIEAIKKLLF
jgi:glycosyltransferase involved in cell wall biosynthesis